MSYAMTEVKVNKPLHVLAEEAIKKMIVLPEYQNGKLLPECPVLQSQPSSIPV